MRRAQSRRDELDEARAAEAEDQGARLPFRDVRRRRPAARRRR
ncbi:hypothetical protein [Actinomadura madurae]|nr:hypothetical protein [Actinomadura madurae]